VEHAVIDLPDVVMQALTARGEVIRRGAEWVGLCPVHADSTPSLRVKIGNNGSVLMRCDPCGDSARFLDLCKGLGIEPADCFPADPPRYLHQQPTATYTYTDARGVPLHRKLRYEPGFNGRKKDFVQEHWTPSGWQRGLGDERALYRLPEVLDAISRHEMVWLAEGESDVEALRRAGVVATTNVNGAAERWDSRYSAIFRDATVTITADTDDPGRERARRLVAELTKVGANVRVVEAAVGKDPRDHLEAGKTLEEFLVTRPFDRVTVRDTWTLREYMELPVIEEPYVLAGLVKRRARLMIVAGEGEGKSELMRQLAVKAAAGFSPFGEREVDPKVVLVIDGENEHQDVIDSYGHLVGLSRRNGAGEDLLDRLVVVEASQNRGRNLLAERDQDWLRERVQAYQPDLITVGPLYKLCFKSVKDDETAQALTSFLDSLRDICGSALMIEHHAPWRSGGDKQREIRPYGSSVLQRWTNFAFGLVPDEDNGGYFWQPLRGSRYRGRPWPERLEVGGPLDWRWVEGAPAGHSRNNSKMNSYAHA
jgi:5S rRNA maturation endonuclease (ribonuclease M5)